MSRYQKGKTNLDFTEARDSEWQWHQLGHMQVCTSLQTDNHASTSPHSFLQAGCPSCRPTNSIKALKANNKQYPENVYESHVAADTQPTRTVSPLANAASTMPHRHAIHQSLHAKFPYILSLLFTAPPTHVAITRIMHVFAGGRSPQGKGQFWGRASLGQMRSTGNIRPKPVIG